SICEHYARRRGVVKRTESEYKSHSTVELRQQIVVVCGWLPCVVEGWCPSLDCPVHSDSARRPRPEDGRTVQQPDLNDPQCVPPEDVGPAISVEVSHPDDAPIGAGGSWQARADSGRPAQEISDAPRFAKRTESSERRDQSRAGSASGAGGGS